MDCETTHQTRQVPDCWILVPCRKGSVVLQTSPCLCLCLCLCLYLCLSMPVSSCILHSEIYNASSMHLICQPRLAPMRLPVSPSLPLALLPPPTHPPAQSPLKMPSCGILARAGRHLNKIKIKTPRLPSPSKPLMQGELDAVSCEICFWVKSAR